MKKILLSLFTILCLQLSAQTTHIVNTTNNSGAGSLRTATIDATDGDIIRFDPSLIATGNDTIKLMSNLDFNKGLTIVGLYNSTDTLVISGINNSRIFDVNLGSASNKVLILDSLILVNGNTTGNGGAINFIDGDSLVIRNSIISGNEGNSGGAIHSLSPIESKIIISNSTINDNTARASNGGAIFSRGNSGNSGSKSTIVISASNLNNNTSNFNGGVIFSSSAFSTVVTDAISNTVTITNSNLNGNTANNDGGAIFSNGYRTLIELDSTVFSDNITTNDGGAIYCESGSPANKITIDNSIFNRNTADLGGGIYSKSLGGANEVIVDNSTFSGNSSVNSGSAIYSSSSTSSVIVNNSTINDNNTGGNGGGIFSTAPSVPASNSIITVSNSTISDNTASFDGGGIYSAVFSTAILTVTNSTITGNIANRNGEAIFSRSASTIVDISSSIVALNGTSTAIFNSTTGASNNTAITSQGYNIFSEATISGSDVSDQLNVMSAQLNLGVLQNNGGTTQTFLPGTGSVAIDMGNPLDLNDAQNRNIAGGIRDIGAAEASCEATPLTLAENICFGDSFMVGDIIFMRDTIGAEVTIQTTNNCDSLVTLNLTIYDAVTGVDVQTACESYAWIDGNTYTESTNTPTHLLVDESLEGCDSTVTLNLTITPLPLNTTSKSGLTITANETGATYQWVDCNNSNSPITGETNVSYTATVDGDYAVIITKNGCSATSACVNISTIGIAKKSIQSQVSIFPNPIHDIVTIQLGDLKDVSLVVHSLKGDIIYQSATINASTHQFELNAASGLYVMIVITEEETVEYKLVKK